MFIVRTASVQYGLIYRLVQSETSMIIKLEINGAGDLITMSCPSYIRYNTPRLWVVYLMKLSQSSLVSFVESCVHLCHST